MKMVTNFKYLLYAIPAVMLAACSNEEPAAGSSDGVAAVVTADIGSTSSRAADTQWGSGDRIGISGTSGSVTYANVPYVTAAGDGVFHALNGESDGIFFHDNKLASFSAYYPYSADVTSGNTVIAASTADQAQAATFDFLYATGARGRVGRPRVKFTGDASFKHSMAQLVINLTTDRNGGFSEGIDLVTANATITLGGIAHEGEFDTATGLAAATGSAAGLSPGSPEITGDIARYRLILFPQTADDVELSIEYEGATYSCTFTPTLSAGKRFTANITLRKTGLTVGSATITDWEDGGSTDGDMTMSGPFEPKKILMREAANGLPDLYFANCNLGATKPQEVGLYFWWGDVEGHELNDGFDFQDSNPLITTNRKTPSQLFANNIVILLDVNKYVLAPQYDAAQVILGNGWRMPTEAELNWLNNNENCTWTWREQTDNSPKGYLVTSKSTSNSIFLPVTGHRYSNNLESGNDGCYWSSSPYGDTDYSYHLRFNKEYYRHVTYGKNYGGNAIRPVHN